MLERVVRARVGGGGEAGRTWDMKRRKTRRGRAPPLHPLTSRPPPPPPPFSTFSTFSRPSPPARAPASRMKRFNEKIASGGRPGVAAAASQRRCCCWSPGYVCVRRRSSETTAWVRAQMKLPAIKMMPRVYALGIRLLSGASEKEREREGACALLLLPFFTVYSISHPTILLSLSFSLFYSFAVAVALSFILCIRFLHFSMVYERLGSSLMDFIYGSSVMRLKIACYVSWRTRDW